MVKEIKVVKVVKVVKVGNVCMVCWVCKVIFRLFVSVQRLLSIDFIRALAPIC